MNSHRTGNILLVILVNFRLTSLIVAELYRDHTLSAEKAAAKLNMPVEQFLARMKMC